MSTVRTSETVSDYDGFDFAGLWKGRKKVTDVERAVLARSLESVDGRRLLEVGTGYGRLLDCLVAKGQEVVALDYDLSALGRVSSAENGRSPVLRVAANLYHLPFVDGAFTGATMIRVLHHLADPVAALTEVGRVLRNGGRLIVSYSPKPSVGTLVNDLQRALRPSAEIPFTSATFSGEGAVELSSSPFPMIVGSRAEFGRWARAARFQPEAELAAGLEEYRLLRSLPTRHFVRWAETFSQAPGFPVRFARLRVSRHDDPPLPQSADILGCPRCGVPWHPSQVDGEIPCPSCPFVGRSREGLLDLRYIPEGVRRQGPARTSLAAAD